MNQTTPETRAAQPLGEVATPRELAYDIASAIEELRVAARAAANASRAESTERAYAADWRDFSAFATRIARNRLPAQAETVALYVAELARRNRKAATIGRKLAAIAVFHRSAGHPSPTEHDVVRAVVRGPRRQRGVEQKQKSALELEPLRAVIAQLPNDTRGIRDRALLLLGWAAALRRSELAALQASQLRFEEEGVLLWLRRSKTDQDGVGDTVAVPYGSDAATCPVRAVHTWLARAGSGVRALSTSATSFLLNSGGYASRCLCGMVNLSPSMGKCPRNRPNISATRNVEAG